MTIAKLGFVAALALLAAATPAWAANVDVQLLDQGDKGAMVFQHDMIKINVGDTVTFQPTNKGHSVQSIEGLLPAGATPVKGELSTPLVATFTVPGVYALKCDPHYKMGMVAVVVVGNDTSNLDAIKNAEYPDRAQDRMDDILSEIGK